MSDLPSPSAPLTFNCPSCGAKLKVPDAASVVCSYCGNSVMVPEELRPQKPQMTVINLGEAFTRQEPAWQPTQTHSAAASWIVVLAITCVLAIGGLVALLAVSQTSGVMGEVQQVIEGVGTQVGVNVPFAPTPVPVAEQVLSFGALGSEPGQFEDPRFIAVDSDGSIFVADYSDGRIHKFDSAGTPQFIIQVTAEDGDDDVYLGGIAVGDGFLYVVREGAILKYATSDGSLADTIPDRWPNIMYDVITVADGVLYTSNGMAGTDDILRLSPEGEILSHWQEVIQSVEDDDPAMSLDFAVTPDGEIFVLSEMGQQVYVYSQEGEFLRRFGEEGNAPGQFSSFPNAIAADAQGRIYIVNSYSIDLYDAQGNYLDKSFELNYDTAAGAIFDLAVGPNGVLYLITGGGKVLVYRLN